jgi:hypothetical protein
VATLKVSDSSPSSQLRDSRGPRRRIIVAGVENQAHANQTIDMSGAVKSLASKLPVRAAETEISTRSMQPRNQRCQASTRSTSIDAVTRFARLCVLIEPNPARRSVLQDLGRILHLHLCCAPRLPSSPPKLLMSDWTQQVSTCHASMAML